MAPTSCASSGSWSAPCDQQQDILDLDRYMRGGIRSNSRDRKREEFVVDAGGLRKPINVIRTDTSSDVSLRKTKAKRFSHDSGLSGETFTRHKYRSHRRPYYPAAGHSRQRDRLPERGSSNSTKSMIAFRLACEQTLLKQQEQIARVAQICEKLTESKPKTCDGESKTPTPAPEKANKKGEVQSKRKTDRTRSIADTSEISSSSRSTFYDKTNFNRRIDECRTYKILMKKLDELHRLYVVRGRSMPRRTVRGSSGDDVTVCDKDVAADFAPRVITPRRNTDIQRNLPISPRVLVERAVGSEVSVNQKVSMRGSNRASVRGVSMQGPRESPRGSGRGAINNHNFQAGSLPYKVSECTDLDNGRSTPKEESTCGEFMSKSFSKHFMLDDPIKLYAQAKQMQAMYATAEYRRSHSSGGSLCSRTRKPRGYSRVSLCSLCRGYWRSFKEFLCCPDSILNQWNQ